MSAAPPRQPSSTAAVVLALLIVYVVWGSTYLAIRVAVETIPPFSMASVRFLIAGAVLLMSGVLVLYFRQLFRQEGEHL